MSDNNENGSNGAASPIIDQAKEQTSQVLQQGQQAASDLASKAVTQVKVTVGTQKDNLAQTVDGVAEALNHAGDKLRETGGDTVAEYASSAADQIKGVSKFLSERNVDELLRETNDFARSKPAIFLSVAVVLGIAAARFLKSSAKSAYPENSTSSELAPGSAEWLPQQSDVAPYSNGSRGLTGDTAVEERTNYAAEPTVA